MRWSIEEVERLKEYSTKDNWKSEEELSILLGRNKQQINKKRWYLHLNRSPEQRRTARHDYICENCGDHFYNKHIGRKFCSEECHRKWQQNHICQHTWTKICLACGKTFEARYPTKKYCSWACGSHKKRNDLSLLNKKRARFDKERFLVLYKMGFSDREISKELADLYLGYSAIAAQRRNMNLPPNSQKRNPPLVRHRSEYMKQYREKHKVKDKKLLDFVGRI